MARDDLTTAEPAAAGAEPIAERSSIMLSNRPIVTAPRAAGRERPAGAKATPSRGPKTRATATSAASPFIVLNASKKTHTYARRSR